MASSTGRTLEGFRGNSLSYGNTFSDDVASTLAANGVYDRRQMDWYNKLVRFPGTDPYNAFTYGKEYVFFTKPDLHLINTYTGNVAGSLKDYAFFVDAVDRYYPVCLQLQGSMNNNGESRIYSSSPFMTILTNSLRSNLDLPALEAENEVETGANVYGTKIIYRGNSYPSDQEVSFSLEFEDTKFLEVYMLFKIYDEYCRAKSMGLIDLRTDFEDDKLWIRYTINKVLHDQFSVYKFIVGEDGMTILYWAKITGVFPTGAPRDAFSEVGIQDGQKITVQFKGQFIKDMDPSILSDFNRTVDTSYHRDLPLWNHDLGVMEPTWATRPYVAINPDYASGNEISKMGKYILQWKR